MKNIVAIKKRVLFHMDRSRSPRYNNEDISNAIQVATSDFINDRYDNIKDQIANYSFESVQRIRDEIKDVVVPIIFPVPATKTVLLPADYMYDVGVEQKVNGIFRNSIPKSISERLGGKRNVFTRPTDYYPVHEEIGSNINFYPGEGLITEAKMYYIKSYELPLITDIVISAGTNVLTQGDQYHVETNPIVYNSITYQPTDTFTAGANLTFTGTGTVRKIIEVALSATTHEELARRAAACLNGIVENYNKNQLKDVEIKKQ